MLQLYSVFSLLVSNDKAMNLIFFLFSIVAILSSLGVVFSKTPLGGLLSLILCFFNVSALFLLIGAEFLAMVLMIVYVGAVAVLFLFMIMMVGGETYPKSPLSLQEGSSIIIALVLLIELIFISHYWFNFEKPSLIIKEKINYSNIHSIGDVLYTNYFGLFQLLGFILFLSMVGAVILCFNPNRVRKNPKKNNKDETAKSVNLITVRPYEGVMEFLKDS